jgi:hypothetical protein
VEVPVRTAVTVAVALAIAANAAVATDVRRQTAIAVAIAESTRTALAAVADLIGREAMPLTADARVFVVVIGRDGARKARTAFADDATTWSRLIGAADFGFHIATRPADVGFLIADLAERILAVSLGTAGVFGPQIQANPLIGAAMAAGGIAGAANAVSLGTTFAEVLDRTAGTSANADRGAAPIDLTTYVIEGTTFRSGIRVANPVRRWDRVFTRAAVVGGTAQLFAVAGAMAASVVAAFRMGRHRRSARDTGAAGRTSAGVAFVRRTRRTGTHPAHRSLIARTLDRRRGGRWSTCRIGIALQRHSPGQRGATQPKDPLEHRAATRP